MASGWAGPRCLPTPQRSEAAGCCRARSGAAGCCRAGSGAAGCCRAICGASTGAARGRCPGSGVSGGCSVASGWAEQRCLPMPQRSGAAGCCGAGSGAAGCCGFFCGAGTGATRGCCPGSGVSGTGPGSGTGRFRSPPGAPQPPPPPLPPWASRAGAEAWQCDTGGGGGAARGADRQGCPAQRKDAAARLPPRGAGALEPGLHSASAVIGRGGRSTPRSRTCICGRGWGSAQPEIWAGMLLRGSQKADASSLLIHPCQRDCLFHSHCLRTTRIRGPHQCIPGCRRT